MATKARVVPICRFCGRSGVGVTFSMMSKHGFGNACTDCDVLPTDTWPVGSRVRVLSRVGSRHVVESVYVNELGTVCYSLVGGGIFSANELERLA